MEILIPKLSETISVIIILGSISEKVLLRLFLTILLAITLVMEFLLMIYYIIQLIRILVAEMGKVMDRIK